MLSPKQLGRSNIKICGGSDSKESACNVGDLGLIPGFERSPGEESGNSPQYSCLEIPWTEEPGRLQSMGSQSSWTQLSDFTPLLHVICYIKKGSIY